MKYSVYLHRLKSDNRVYIGMTKQKVKKRWQRGLGYEHSVRFFEAIKKYGWDNFEHIVIYENLSQEDAEKKEKELIKKYKSTDERYGFNICDGGLNPSIPIELREKISKTEKGKKISKETIEKSNNTKRKRYLEYGLTDKQKKHYESMIKPIKCIETNKIYYGHKDLKKDGFNSSNIYSVCSGLRERAYGFHWQHYKEG